MLAQLKSLAAAKLSKDDKAPAKADSTSPKNAAAAPDSVVGFFELGDLSKIQAVLGEVDDPVYKVRDYLLNAVVRMLPRRQQLLLACWIHLLSPAVCCCCCAGWQAAPAPCCNLWSRSYSTVAAVRGCERGCCRPGAQLRNQATWGG
jgi:hypothetical protein